MLHSQLRRQHMKAILMLQNLSIKEYSWWVIFQVICAIFQVICASATQEDQCNLAWMESSKIYHCKLQLVYVSILVTVLLLSLMLFQFMAQMIGVAIVASITEVDSYATVVSVMHEPVAALMRVLTDIFTNYKGCFVTRSDAYEDIVIQGTKLLLPVLNQAKLFHPMVINNNWYDTDQRNSLIKKSYFTLK